MKSYSIEEYKLAGCEEMEVSTMRAVHGLSNGKVCDTGCHAFNNGKCSAYRNLSGSKTIQEHLKTTMIETVREEATRRNISISEVRRQRRDK